MRLLLGALWSLGQTPLPPWFLAPSVLRILQVDGTVMLAEGCHQGSLCYGDSATRLQRLSTMRLPLPEERSKCHDVGGAGGKHAR
jgi:hypothetical protein